VTDFILPFLAALRVLVRSRADLALEILALRHQVAVLKRKQARPRLKVYNRLFWIALRRFWPGWKRVLVIVKPDTVVAWHRSAFCWYWRWRSGLRRQTSNQRGTSCTDPSSGAGESRLGTRIHVELLKLGFNVCERTVARYLRRVRQRGDPAKSWLTFLENHREVIVALDFFTVPTITFQLLYGSSEEIVGGIGFGQLAK